MTETLLVTLIAIGAFFATGTGLAQEAVNGDELYRTFREYRRLVSYAASNPASFFSRAQMAELLGYAQHATAQSREAVLEVIRDQVRFGANVETVYSYKAVAPHDGFETLRIICECTNFTSGFGAIEISFVIEDGERRINHLLFDSNVKRPSGDVPIVETFKPDATNK